MLNPKILVTICCYNHGIYLEDAVKSIMTQTYTNLDICIVNDGSDSDQGIDKIIDALESQDSRVRSIRFKENKGKWFGLNEAIRTTTAEFCTSHDADDISLPDRIERQLVCLIQTQTVHNLCGFHHCWTESDVNRILETYTPPDSIKSIEPSHVSNAVNFGMATPGINHYFTGDFETAGVSALFMKKIWDLGIRFNPPELGLRTLLSEDSDFNFRVTAIFGKTSILAEKPYCYRRNTSTNQELA